ncbi:hypothetical protein BDV93DRAFT_515150 [Ceratobasidium sp. AG-I]|nr:hypothetical protein BDV93DRAFT_515150 [Ceratobasidium sp. AG-I]
MSYMAPKSKCHLPQERKLRLSSPGAAAGSVSITPGISRGNLVRPGTVQIAPRSILATLASSQTAAQTLARNIPTDSGLASSSQTPPLNSSSGTRPNPRLPCVASILAPSTHIHSTLNSVAFPLDSTPVGGEDLNLGLSAPHLVPDAGDTGGEAVGQVNLLCGELACTPGETFVKPSAMPQICFINSQIVLDEDAQFYDRAGPGEPEGRGRNSCRGRGGLDEVLEPGKLYDEGGEQKGAYGWWMRLRCFIG